MHLPQCPLTGCGATATTRQTKPTLYMQPQVRQFINLRAPFYTFRDVAYKPGWTPLIEESQKLRVAALLSDHIRLRHKQLYT